MMKKKYARPEMHFIPNEGGVEITAVGCIPEMQLQDYLAESKKAEYGLLMKANGDFVSRQVGDECILVPVGNSAQGMNAMITLNRTGQFLWEQFQQPNTLAKVVALAHERYEDDENRMESEIRDFVFQYRMSGLLVTCEDLN